MKSKVRKEYEAALAKAEVTPFEGKDDVIDLYTDVVCGAVLVAEENAKQIGGPTWQNAGLWPRRSGFDSHPSTHT